MSLRRNIVAIRRRAEQEPSAEIPPSAAFTATPVTGAAPLTVSVNASGSTDVDGTIVSYAWNWGDGTTGSGVIANHSYTSDGNYTITLTVTDNDGHTGTASQPVEVASSAVAPVASFTRTPANGEYPLVVNVDASGSSDPDGSISSYAWNWGDGTADGSGVTTTHTYTAQGTYTITLTVTDNDTLTSQATRTVQVNAPQTWPVTMTTEDTTWCMIHLSWTNNYGQREPWVLQRREDTNFTTPDLNAPQSYDNFIWLSHGPSVTRYKDLHNWEQAGKTFYYRATAVLNLASVKKYGIAPVFGAWETGVGTLDDLPSGWGVTNASVTADDATNGWAAIKAAAAARASAGGGIVQLPAGTIRCWPTDAAVQEYGGSGGQLYKANGASSQGAMLSGQLSNVVLQGHLDAQGNPATILNMRMWNDRPPTDWLVELTSGGTDPTNDAHITRISRFGFWLVGASGTDVENIQLRRLKINGGAVPVNSGKEPGTTGDNARYQWDESHWVMKGFHNSRNWLIEDVRTVNWRAENFYTGGFGHEKIKLVRVNATQSNSSITSFSADVEYEDCYFADAANALIESATHSLAGDDSDPAMTSPFSSLRVYHDTIVRRLRGRCLDQSSAGVFKSLPGARNFAGIHIFNQKDTFQSVTDCVIEDFWQRAYGPWYECEDGFVYNNLFRNAVRQDVHWLDFRPAVNALYKLSGGMENMWIFDNVLSLNKHIWNGGSIYYVQTGLASMNDTWIEQLLVQGNGNQVRRVTQDSYQAGSGRDGFVLKDWTKTNLGTDAYGMIEDLTDSAGNPTGTRILPLMEDMDFFANERYVTPTDPLFNVQWYHTVLRSSTSDTDFYVRPRNLSLCPVGQVFILQAARSTDRLRLAASTAWNTWTSEVVVNPGQVLRVTVVNDGGTRKLEYTSLT